MITEILEGILEWLPPAKLHVIQRVNKRFQNVIINSLRMRKRMFRRIDNDPGIPWTFYQRPHRSDPLRFLDPWSLTQASSINSETSETIMPVEISPLLYLLDLSEPIDGTFDYGTRGRLMRGITLQLCDGQASTIEQIGQQNSIYGTFISDPHCPSIEVTLRFSLGERRPTSITVRSLVESDSPITIGVVILRALDTHGAIQIQWRSDGFTARRGSERREGIPKHLLHGMERELGLEVYFQPSGSNFRLKRIVAPTDKLRAIVVSRHMEEPVLVSNRNAPH